MSDAPDPLAALIEQARRVVAHHPGLGPAYLAAIREKAKGMKPEELEALLGDLARQPLTPPAISDTK